MPPVLADISIIWPVLLYLYTRSTRRAHASSAQPSGRTLSLRDFGLPALWYSPLRSSTPATVKAARVRPGVAVEDAREEMRQFAERL